MAPSASSVAIARMWRLVATRLVATLVLLACCSSAWSVPSPALALATRPSSAGRRQKTPTAVQRRAMHLHGMLRVGARGPIVQLLQDELARLRYEVPVNGRFDEATGRAVLAFRKVAGLERIESANAGVFQRLAHGAGRYRVRFPQDGNHVEADLTKQVLVEVEHGGVRRILTMSSGKPSTPTVIGHFNVYSKTPGVNSEGMVDSNYFIRGYAIHGYAEVPPYAASHGCLRIPVPNAAAVFAWIQVGYAVDVYTDSGHGSHRVRADAGP